MAYQHLLAALAFTLIGALVGGRLASLANIPRVTGYLLAGMLMGPSITGWLNLPTAFTEAVRHEMSLITDLALALIMLSIGGQLQTENLRRWKHRILIFSLSEIGVTASLVALFTGTCNQFILRYHVPGLSVLETSLMFGLFLGVIGVATAPAATLMVAREVEADGPVTDVALTLVGLNNLACVVAFTLLSHFLLGGQIDLWLLGQQLAGPVVVGGAGGVLVAFWSQRLEMSTEFKLLLLGGSAAVVTLADHLSMNPMLAGLAFGATLANSSPRWDRLQKALKQVDYPLYVCFFVLAGANLHLESLAHIGLIGVAYVIARTIGKLAGARLGAHWGRFGERERSWIGMTLMAQAGMAIGLAVSLRRQWPEGGPLVETVVLGSVVIFELFGPLAVRRGLVQAGEVPILSMLHKRAPQGAMEGLHNVAHHFRLSLGLPEGHRLKDPGDILVQHIMRRNVDALKVSTPFNKLLQKIAHSRYDRFPVIDQEGHFVGMINYTEIRSLLFEPTLAKLIVAGDLVSVDHLHVEPQQSLRSAVDLFHQHRDISYFPVLDPDHPEKLLGILSQNDVMAAFRRLSPEG